MYFSCVKCWGFISIILLFTTNSFAVNYNSFDERNTAIQATAYLENGTQNELTSVNDYAERNITYDLNGNILGLRRNDYG